MGIAKSIGSLVLGNYNEREIRRMRRVAEQINALEPEMQARSDAALKACTDEFRRRLEAGQTLEDLLVEAFAVAREAARRALGMRPFDVQLVGGMVLHQGRIAEMKTGEGKTLVAVLPVYLNALTGRGVHVVTVNDYLARRDAEWMGKVYDFLGLSVGVVVPGMDYAERRAAYAADVTYGTNNELGFDYLRDNMVLHPDEMVQRELNYAIVDEVDSILIDEARTPLIISGPAEESTELYYRFARVVPRLKETDDYTVDEKAHTAAPTEQGIAKVERLLGVGNLYDDRNMDLSHYLMQALKAHALMKRDRDYVVKDGEVIIVDEFTGRLMFGRRYSDGLHQAIEAKEGVKIEQESQTLATITFQNFFRMYDKLAGMTGTAATEEEEFRKIYGIDVIVVPTYKNMIRRDLPDLVYKTEAAKFRAVVEEIVRRHEAGQPVLVGTVSIEKSERLSELLKRRGIPHQVLNAKYHEQEAHIVAKAGQPAAVTIATNMAGRGTDIVLGEGVAGRGGLFILGTERHESRRIDNQLRGRSGRQGDPGESRFYLSLEDDLLRIFGSDNIKGLMDRLGMEEDQPIEHALLTRALENAQRRVENRNFDIRKQVLQYDDVINTQREIIYRQRRQVVRGENLQEAVLGMVDACIDRMLGLFCEDQHPEEWNLAGLVEYAEGIFLEPGRVRPEDLAGLDLEALSTFLREAARGAYQAKERTVGEETMRELERVILLRVVDTKWNEHLDNMDELREGIGLRAYGQRDPLVEYKHEAFDTFQEMVQGIQEDVARYIYHVNVVTEPEERVMVVNQGPEAAAPAPAAPGAKVGRNDPCPCGSGKKYKKCCGKGK